MNLFITLALILSGGYALYSVGGDIEITETTQVISQEGEVRQYSNNKKLIENDEDIKKYIEQQVSNLKNSDELKSILKTTKNEVGRVIKSKIESDEVKDYIKIIIEE